MANINIRAKGQNGEREIASSLNLILNNVLKINGLPIPAVDVIQRNQNQSAVGGSDLSNTFGLAIEIKRHETLSINTWWKQCLAAAERNREIPVLIFRQNRAAWRVIMFGAVEFNRATAGQLMCRVEISWEDFQFWFYKYCDAKIKSGELPKV